MMQAYSTVSVTLVRFKGQDKYQEPNPTDTKALKGFVEYKYRTIQKPDGTVVASNASVDLPNHTIISSGYSARVDKTISFRDTITIDGVSHTIVGITQPRDFRQRYTKVFIA
uniref:Head-tail joining protein n=1 Tax=viral metagenome TaxID=1070528 RepID=A0A6M3JZ60_9ZZZZ